MDPVSIIGGAIGIGKAFAKLGQRIKQRRNPQPEPKPMAPAQLAGSAGAAGPGLAISGQNPVAQAGLQVSQPTIVSPAAQGQGQIKLRGAPSSLDRAKQDYLFRVAMNGE